MPTGSRGLSFFLAIAIAAVVTAFLYLIPSTSSTVLWAALLLSFSISYLLISITLEFLVFREIGNIYTLLEKIQKKDLTEIKNKSLGSSLSPLKKINTVINERTEPPVQSIVGIISTTDENFSIMFFELINILFRNIFSNIKSCNPIWIDFFCKTCVFYCPNTIKRIISKKTKRYQTHTKFHNNNQHCGIQTQIHL